MRKIITISTQTISNTVVVCKKLPKASLFIVLLTVLSFGFSGNLFAQCSNMVMSNGTPLWNGNEYCTGYNPAPINAPIINYTGTCLNTPAYSYKWEQNINGLGWTIISANAAGTRVSTVPGFNPPALFNTPAGNPLETWQWRLTIVDSANSNQSAQSSNFTVFIVSQMVGTNVTTMTCANPVNGTINLTVLGGISGPSYTWTGSAGGVVPPSQVNVEDPTGLTAGNYNVIVNDGGCTNLSYNVTVSAAGVLTAAISSTTNILCNGASTGAATVSPAGGAPSGSPTYTYAWTPSGGSGATASGLAAGPYTVTVTDGSGCSVSTSTTLTQPATAVSASTTNTGNVLCFGGNQGSASVTAGGGVAGYTYSWAPSGGSAASATGLIAGTYTVTVTDANLCTATSTVVITEPTAVTATTSVINNVSCFGGSNGSASVLAGGGTPGYTYSWAPSGGTAAVASGLAAGTYTVTVTDANLCAKTSTVVITEPTQVTATTSVVNSVSCNGGANGSASVLASGGTPGYTYSWAPSGGTAATASGLAAGTYTVTVTDANLCSTTSTAIITEPSPVSGVTSVMNNVSCFNGSNGKAKVVAAGGTGYGNMVVDYTVTFSNTSVSPNPPDQYVSVEVYDGSTNVVATSGGINNYAPYGGTTSMSSTLSFPANNPPYTLVLSGEEAAGGTASISANVICDLGNTIIASGTLNLPTNGSTQSSNFSIPPCYGTTPAYTYSWLPSGGTADTTSGTLTAGNYTVTITDAAGCTGTATVTITEPTVIVATATSTAPTCPSYNNGTASVVASGGTPSLSGYLFVLSNTFPGTPGDGTVTLYDGSNAVVYFNPSVTSFVSSPPIAITNPPYRIEFNVNQTSNGGLNTNKVEVFCEPNPVLTFANQIFVDCLMGLASPLTCLPGGYYTQILPSCGTPTYNYSWAPTGGTAATATGLSAATYTVTVTDANSCTKTTTVTLTNSPIGPVHNTTTNVNYCTIQEAINAASFGDAITVDAGNYNEDVLINKSVSLTGAGCGLTTVSGPIGGVSGATMSVQAANVIIDGFTITRDGNNPTDWFNPGLNSAGISIQTPPYAAEVRNCCIVGNRTGIDINNSNGNNIHNNFIDNNRTGMVFRNQTDNTNVQNNFITNNWTLGVLFLDGSNVGTGIQQALNSTFNNNNISGNWYGEVVDRQTGGSLPAPGANLKNFECNWYGASAMPTTSTANSTEPGYASSPIPVIYGGTGTAPGGQPDILGTASANIDFTPWTIDGTDIAAATMGWQPTAGSCVGTPVVITIDSFRNERCGNNNGWINTTLSGGSGTYTVSWAPSGGTADDATGLAAGTYTITVTDGYGTTATKTQTLIYLPVTNSTQSKDYATIQAAIDAATTVNGDVIAVCQGTYNEDVVINKSLTLNGPNANASCYSGTRATEANIIGLGGANTVAVKIAADNVTVNGFNISNPNGSYGVSEQGRSNINVSYNIVSNVGNATTGSGPSYGIHAESNAPSSNINFTNNCVSNIRGGTNGCPNGANGSGVGIGATSSNSTSNMTNLNISYNTISNISACNFGGSGGKGAYGVIINIGASAAGQAINAIVSNNEISNLNGRWAHGIGLEGKTPGASVMNNSISNLTAAGTMPNIDAEAIKIEQNASASTVQIHENSFTNAAYSIINSVSATINATCNWHGTATPSAVTALNVNTAGGTITTSPFLLSGADTNPAIGFQPAAGCTAPCALVATMSSVTASCPSFNNGTATVSVAGGTGSYTYLWSPGGQTTATATGLTTGDYTVTVTDVNGCTTMSTVTVGTTYVGLTNPTDGASTVECLPAGLPTPPTVLDVCGTTITPTGPVATGTYAGCEGTKIYTYVYTDTWGSSVDWAYTYTVDHTTAPVVPANGASTVECLTSATTPTTPTVTDVCAAPLTAALDSTIDAPVSITCEGSRTYYYSYTDCSGLKSLWKYTYTIDHTTAPVVPANGASTVQCIANATTPTPPAGIVDVCGAAISAVLDSTIDSPASLTCEGTRTYYYSYTDCSGLRSPWTYTYTIDRTTAPSTVNTQLVAMDRLQPEVRVYNPTTLALISTATLTLAGYTLGSVGSGAQSFGLSVTYNPADGKYYAIVSTSVGRQLVTVNPTTGVCTLIGAFGQFSSLTCSPSGTLYTIGGNGSGSTAERLYSVNTATAATTFLGGPYSVGADGEIIAYNRDDNYIYHWSGNATANMEKINATTFAATPIIQSGISHGEVFAAVYTGNGNFLLSTLGALEFYNQTSTGFTTNSTVNTGTAGVPLRGFGLSDGVSKSSTVACASSATAPTTLPVVKDVCGNTLTPTGAPTMGGTSTGCAGTKTYTYNYVDCSGLPFSWTYTYTISAPVPVALTCPNDTTVAPCQTQLTVNAAYAAWLAQASFTGGCDANLSNNSLGAPNAGGGSVTVDFTVFSSCEADVVCTKTFTVPGPVVIDSVPQINITCNGANNGSATVYHHGGTAPHTYSWAPSGGTAASASGLAPGTYTVTVTDNTGCSVTSSITITQPAVLVATETHTNVLCHGGNTGTATISATGGTAPYTGTGLFTGLAQGTYTYNVSDANGCTSNVVVTITQPTAVAPVVTITAGITCFGAGNGSALVTTTGGTPYTPTIPHPFQYDYLWSTGGTGIVENLIVPGTHTITVTDANGCVGTDTFTMTQPPLLVATATVISNVNCNGDSTGHAVVAITGGTPFALPMPEYVINWSSGGTFLNEFDLWAATHTVYVSDANGCATSATVTITQPTAIVVTASATPILCNGGNSTVTITSSGGVAPYTGTGTFTVTAGTYTYTVTDANGCTKSTSITITQPNALVASSTATSIACNGGSATVTVSASGGTAPYTGTGNFTVTAGTYTYTVTDNNGCSTTTTITVAEPSLLVASSTATAVACNGGNATVSVSAAGGTAPYTGTGNFTVTAGTYTYTVTDFNGCSTTTTITVGQPSALSASSTATTILCNGGSATVTVSATGGTAPYTGTGNFTVTAGTYTYTVTDNNGCSTTTSITVGEPSALVASSSATAIGCNGGTATVTVSATGGTAPYTGTGNFTVSAGTYTYTVTDNNGCSTTTSIVVGQPNSLVASSTATSILCNGGNATVTVSATGGSAPYTGTGNFTVNAGTYTYTVTDNNGCSNTTTITVGQPSVLNASSTATSILCNGGNATVSVSATGGTAPYSGTGNFTVTAGTYTYTVTDNNGCSTTTSITVGEPTLLVASSTATSILCNGGSATVTVSATGGTAPYTGTGNFTVTAGTYTYTVTDINGCTKQTVITFGEPSLLVASSTATAVACNGGNATVTVSATGGTAPYTGTGNFTVTAGTYTYTVTDNNGCSTTTTITVGQPNSLAASSSATAILCNGGNATVTVSATGGTTPYSGTGNFTVTEGTYTYTVTDFNGCSTTTSITVGEPTALSASSTATAITCNGGSSTVTVSATGGTAPYSGTGSFTVTAGTYTYTVTDFNGCSTTTSITVNEPTLLVASSTATAVACNGGNATVTVSATGGTAPYTGTGNFTVTAGTYTYTVTDNNGCSTTTTITVGQPNSLVASSTATSILCNGGTATVTVSAAGGTTPYSGTGNFTVTAGTYTYTVTDFNGCSTTTTITVGEPTLLVASSTATSILCNGGSATVTVSATGGTAPYTGTGNFTVTAGTYTYTVTDFNGCTMQTVITVSEPSLLVASSTSTAITCNGGSSTVTVSATGGTAPYTGTGNFTVSAGTYTYTVTDNNGCSTTTTITVAQPAAITMSSSPIACDSYTWNSNTYTMSGVHTATFTNANGCDSVHTINLTIKYKSTNTISHTASLSYTWPVTGLSYSLSGTYTGTIVGGNAVGCDSVITLNLTILGVRITSKVFLDGPFDGVSLMHDSLRSILPTTEPYSAFPYTRPAIGGPSGETTTAGVLAVTGNNAIVDWVFLELRTGSLPNPSVVATKRALVQRDGDIVAEDGVSPVTFSSTPVGNYFVTIKHRNHLGVMTNAMQALTLSGTNVDFTSIALWTKPSFPALVNTPAKLVGGVQVLWAGDALINKNVKYNGASNDKDAVLAQVGSATPNNIIPPTGKLYKEQDVNMDGIIKYNNTNADRLTILGTVTPATPNAIYNQHTPD